MKRLIYLLMSLSFVAFVSCSDDDKEVNKTENGHEYVDLGLTSGTKWATCNVGANKPQDYGDYYAWGEVTTKSTYNWSTYLDGNMSSYSDCGTDKDALKGVTDIAGTEYDAAKANWGGKWCMPTKAQQDELRSECYWVWTSSYNNSNVAGYIVYKAKNSSDKGKCVHLTELRHRLTPSPMPMSFCLLRAIAAMATSPTLGQAATIGLRRWMLTIRTSRGATVSFLAT